VRATSPDAPVLFAAGEFVAFEMDVGDVPALQVFFDANPDYFLATTGQMARPDEALSELHDTPPPEMAWTYKWFVGFRDATGALVGMANVWSDFIAKGVWHIGLFVSASHLHGSGHPHAMYLALEAWMCQRGAAWVRLGVVMGNAKPEKFWVKQGYRQVRERRDVAMGNRTHTLRVMVKPLSGGAVAQYLAMVQRDRPDAG